MRVAALLVLVGCGGREVVSDVDASLDASADSLGSPFCFVQGDETAAVESCGACGEGLNVNVQPDDCSPGGGAAFEYVPLTDVVIGRIELHTDVATIGLLDSDSECTAPGKVLFLGQTDSEGTSLDWRGAFVNPPITVKAHHRYFVYQGPASGHIGSACSIAKTGSSVREYDAPSVNGPWSAPVNALAWTARLDGVCP